MTFQPRDIDEILSSLESNLKGKIEKLSNFTRRSFNFIFARAFATEVRETEVRNLASELSGFIDYTGGPVTQNDLDTLGVEGVEPAEVNEYMADEFLDEYVKIVGIRRFEGTRATGTVTINTQLSRTIIPEGTVVTTDVNATGDTLAFETVSRTIVEDEVTVVSDVSIQAQEIGTEHNVPADSIVRFQNPPIGVQAVTNTEATTGGEERESNQELRERAKNAVQSSSEGGTADGVKGAIRKNVDGVGQGDVAIDELFDRDPTVVDVVVDGGIRESVINEIEQSRPVGIRHQLVRPQTVQVGLNSFVSTDLSVDTERIENSVDTFLLEKGIGDDFFEDELIREIMTSDERVKNIKSLGAFVERVTNEEFFFDDTQVEYELSFTYEDERGSIRIEDEDGTVFNEGTDFTVQDTTGDGFTETIVWDTTSLTPADGERFTVDYDVTVQRDTIEDEQITFQSGVTEYALNYIVEPDTTVSIIDADDNSFEQGTDFTVIDTDSDTLSDTISWSTAPDTAQPDANTDFFVTYSLADESKTNPDLFRFTNDIRDETFVWNLDFTETEDYENTQDIYKLTHVPFESSLVQITDVDGNTFDKGTDFSLIDETGNGFAQSIDWSIGGSSPADNVVFTVSYDQKVYLTENDIIESDTETIRDESGEQYEEGVDYSIASFNTQTNESDAIEWIQRPAGLSNGEEFYFSYVSEGDLPITNREKLTAGTVTVDVI